MDLVKDETGLEAGWDCRPWAAAKRPGRQSRPASRPVSSLTRSTPLCFSLERLCCKDTLFISMVCRRTTSHFFGFWSLIEATLNFFETLPIHSSSQIHYKITLKDYVLSAHSVFWTSWPLLPPLARTMYMVPTPNQRWTIPEIWTQYQYPIPLKSPKQYPIPIPIPLDVP